MEADSLVRLFTVVAVLLGIANTVMVWLQRGNRVIAEKVDKHETKLIAHDRRIQAVEDGMRHLPTKDDLNAIGKIATRLETEVSIMARVVNRIDESLRSRP